MMPKNNKLRMGTGEVNPAPTQHTTQPLPNYRRLAVTHAFAVCSGGDSSPLDTLGTVTRSDTFDKSAKNEQKNISVGEAIALHVGLGGEL